MAMERARDRSRSRDSSLAGPPLARPTSRCPVVRVGTPRPPNYLPPGGPRPRPKATPKAFVPRRPGPQLRGRGVVVPASAAAAAHAVRPQIPKAAAGVRVPRLRQRPSGPTPDDHSGSASARPQLGSEAFASNAVWGPWQSSPLPPGAHPMRDGQRLILPGPATIAERARVLLPSQTSPRYRRQTLWTCARCNANAAAL